MKKGIILVALACVLVASLVVAGCAPAPKPAPAPAPAPAPKPEPIKLVFGTQNPETGWEVQNCTKPWLKAIEQATNGQVKTEGFYGESLFKATAAWEATKTGQTDMALITLSGYAGVFSVNEMATLPFMPYASAESGGAALWQVYEKYPSMQKQWADAKVLNFVILQPFFPVTREKQIKTIDDFKGLRLRALGGPQTDALKLLGATPMFMSINDVYLNIEKGVIDGSLVPWEALMAYKINEVVKYYTYVPFGASTFGVVMNLKKWNSLSPEIQKAIMSVSGQKGSALWSKNFGDGSFAEGRKVIGGRGTPMIEYTVPQDEVDKWVAVTADATREKWIKDNEAKGITDARAILNDYIKFLKEYKSQ